ncbi:MAG: hypothetical protein LBS83_03055 [Holosporales bacterium]|jgi:hypothetical protein|nr:hypothetical protein [Holosporales bacterium]
MFLVFIFINSEGANIFAFNTDIKELKKYTDKRCFENFKFLLQLAEQSIDALIDKKIMLFIRYIEDFYIELIKFSSIAQTYFQRPQLQIFYNTIAQLIIRFELYLSAFPGSIIDLSQVSENIDEQLYRIKNPRFFLIFDTLRKATKQTIEEPSNFFPKTLCDDDEIAKKILEMFEFKENFLLIKKQEERKNSIVKWIIYTYSSLAQRSKGNLRIYDYRILKNNENLADKDSSKSNESKIPIIISTPLLNEKRRALSEKMRILLQNIEKINNSSNFSNFYASGSLGLSEKIFTNSFSN